LKKLQEGERIIGIAVRNQNEQLQEGERIIGIAARLKSE